MPTVVSVFGVEPIRIGGTETFAREVSLQLGRQGWQSVLCFQSQPSDEVASFLNLPNVTVEVLENSTHFSWNALMHFSRLLRRYRPEIVHLHFIGFLGLFPWVARLLLVKKVFFTDHSSRPGGYSPQRAPFWKRWAARLINYPITKVICVSEFGCRCIKALDLLPDDRYELVYNGVDLTRLSDGAARGFEFRRRFGIPDGKKVAVQISWIIPEKGIPDFLDAARLVVARDQNVHFVVVGDGPYREQYMKQAVEMGLGESVTWTGLITNPFGEGVYDAADVVCQFSRWEELFGWMIAEAMAHKKPVIATRVGGIPELVADQKSGYLVERGDTADAAEKLLKLLYDPRLRETMGAEGYRIVHDRFSLRQNVRELLWVYGFKDDYS